MKARKKGTNDDWRDVQYVQLQDSYVIWPAMNMEFDASSTEEKTNAPISEEDHWQGVRERAAIAAMQGMLSNPKLIAIMPHDYRITIDSVAVYCADRLVEQLKKERQ